MLIKKYLILMLILIICAGSVFAQRYERDGYDHWFRGIGNEPFSIPDGPGSPGDITAGEPRTAAGHGVDGEEYSEGIDGEAKGGTDPRIVFRAGSSVALVPLQFSSRDTAEHQDNYWVGTGVGAFRTGLSLSGNHEGKLGFNASVSFALSNGGTPSDVGVGSGFIWIKPTDWFKFNIGNFYSGTQTGYVDGYWLSMWTVGMFDGDNIFSAHSSGNIGMLAQFNVPEFDRPLYNYLKGLSFYIYVPNLGSPFTGDSPDFPWLPNSTLTPGGDILNSDDSGTNMQRALRVFERTWFTIGYKINESMHARAQFMGANSGGSINWTADSLDVSPYRYRVSVNAPRFEAAFAYSTKVISLDLGVKTWLPVSSWITDTWSQDSDNPGYIKIENPGTFHGGFGFGFGASASINDNINIKLRADADMFRSWTGPFMGSGVETTITNPTRLSFHLWPSYELPNGMVIMAAAGLNYVGRNSVDIGGVNPNDGNLNWERSDRLRFGGGLSLAIPLFGAGQMAIGLAYSHGTEDARGGEPRTFTIPLTFFLGM